MTRPSRDEAVTVAYNEVTATDFSPERTTEALEQLWDTAVALLPAETPRVVTTVERTNLAERLRQFAESLRMDYDSPALAQMLEEAADALDTPAAETPRVVTTVAELEALPDGSRIQMTGTKAPFVKQDGEWWSTHVPGKPVYDYLQGGFFPATVLTPAPEREPVTTDVARNVLEALADENYIDGFLTEEPDAIDVVREVLRAANVQPGGESDAV